MLASPFAFYRGAAAIMAADLAPTPQSGLRVQLCGDAHLSNFGGFASPERALVFDVNDFDETLPGPGSGTSSASRRASRSPGASNGFPAGRPAARRARRPSRAYRERDARVRRDARRSTSGTRASTSDELLERVRRRRVGAAGARRLERTVTKARTQGQHARVRQAHARGRRRAAHRQRPAADRADRGARSTGARGSDRGRRPRR